MSFVILRALWIPWFFKICLLYWTNGFTNSRFKFKLQLISNTLFYFIHRLTQSSKYEKSVKFESHTHTFTHAVCVRACVCMCVCLFLMHLILKHLLKIVIWAFVFVKYVWHCHASAQVMLRQMNLFFCNMIWLKLCLKCRE